MKKTLLVWGSFLTLIFVAILAYSMYCDGTTYTCGNLKEDTDRIFRASIRQILMIAMTVEVMTVVAMTVEVICLLVSQIKIVLATEMLAAELE